ncbi:hypothetical protein WJX73_008939 [Symbiochloris irregularis]|uniref:Uncharacterized protein n=1 Tax=Symbiochloris irregularis TaxID=706552 RepID=A0AAW1NV69_9CHLO
MEGGAVEATDHIDQSTPLGRQLARAHANFMCRDIQVLDNASGRLDDLFTRLGYTFQNPLLVQSLAFVVVPKRFRVRADRQHVSIQGNEILSHIGQPVWRLSPC